MDRTVIEAAFRSGRLQLDLRAGAWSPRVIQVSDRGVEVALVATRALLLAGDAVRLKVRLGAGVRLRLLDIAGTVAYNSRGGLATWEVELVLGAGAVLLWDAAPVVVAQGANLIRRTAVILDSGAVACLRETTVLGRSGESGGHLDSWLRVVNPEGPVLTEHLVTDRTHRWPGVLAGVKVMDQAFLLGRRPPSQLDSESLPGALQNGVMELELPGAVVRRLGAGTHQASVAHQWNQWAESIRLGAE
jgi:urease accessory protein